jgi:hypothetical protein
MISGTVACSSSSEDLGLVMLAITDGPRTSVLGRRRAQAKAHRERDDLATRFEDTLNAMQSEMREVRRHPATMNTLGDIEKERGSDTVR